MKNKPNILIIWYHRFFRDEVLCTGKQLKTVYENMDDKDHLYKDWIEPYVLQVVEDDYYYWLS